MGNSLVRSALLAASESRWLRQRAIHLKLVQRAVRRFIPGEHVEDALRAAALLQQAGIRIVLTQLGESVSDSHQADRVTQHYTEVLATTAGRGLDCHISVKPTQLGLDVDQERCYRNLRTLAASATSTGSFVWIDMEQYAYVDRTLSLYRRILSEFPTVGVCLQAYLYRTADDLASLDHPGGGVRLVKGAYREPASVAHQRKRDIDANFLALAQQMLKPAAPGRRAVFGTHDHTMIAGIQERVERTKVRRDTLEFHLLYGIQSATQERLAKEGYGVRTLISYGEQWFPWFMRRLAERPANILLLAKSTFPGNAPATRD